MTKEIWRDVVGYEGLYKVSSEGRVWSVKNDRELKQFDNGRGYKMLVLVKDKVKKRFYVHRLVCLTFLENPLEKQQVNHINSIRSDNRLINLEWSTAYENNTHNNRHLTAGEKKRIAVEQYTLDGVYIQTFKSFKEASDYINGFSSGISSAVRGKNPSYKGFIWKYAN